MSPEEPRAHPIYRSLLCNARDSAISGRLFGRLEGSALRVAELECQRRLLSSIHLKVWTVQEKNLAILATEFVIEIVGSGVGIGLDGSRFVLGSEHLLRLEWGGWENANLC